MAVKVTIDVGNGEPKTYECDGAVCACIEQGKGPTGLEVTVVDGGHLSYSEKCRAIVAMNAAVYSTVAKVIEEELNGIRA